MASCAPVVGARPDRPICTSGHRLTDGTPRLPNLAHRFCVAPMMEWTDRHCRFFHRRLTRGALLYTEMVVADAVLRGDRGKLLGFSPEEHPVALQLGGSEPAKLAAAAAVAATLGY